MSSPTSQHPNFAGQKVGGGYSGTIRLTLTVFLSSISVLSAIAFVYLCYRSRWKAGSLRAFPEEPQPDAPATASPVSRAPVHEAIEVKHPDGTIDYVKAVQPRYSPIAPLQVAPSRQQHLELV